MEDFMTHRKGMTFIMVVITALLAGRLYAAEPFIINELGALQTPGEPIEMLRAAAGKPGTADVLLYEKPSRSTVPLSGNGWHWFRFTIDNRRDSAQPIVFVNEFQCAEMVLTDPTSPKAPIWSGGYHIVDQRISSFFPAAAFEVPSGKFTYYVGMNTRGQPSMFAPRLELQNEYLLGFDRTTMVMMLVMGIHLGVMIYNVVLLIGIRSRLQWTNLLLTFAYLVNSTTLHGISMFFQLTHAEAFIRLWFPALCLGFGGFSLYVIDYFGLERAAHLLWRRVFAILAGMFMLPAILYYAATPLTDVVFVPMAILAGGLYVALLARRFARDKFLGILFIVAFLPSYVCLALFGLMLYGFFGHVGALLGLMNIGGAYTAIVLAWTLSIRLKRHLMQITSTDESIALGRAVQDLLLPSESQADFAHFTYRFCYAPFEGSMSGDWIQCWWRRNGDFCMVLGDVTGKGPQAAIAVAAIATVVNAAKQQGMDVDEVIAEIDDTLYSLFDGKVFTTATAITITPDGHAVMLNAGGVGWLVMHAGKCTHFASSSGWLGNGAKFNTPKLEWSLRRADVLMTVTDGICEGSREARRLSLAMEEMNRSHYNMNQYCDIVMHTKSRMGDDRTMFLIMGKGEADSIGLSIKKLAV